MRLYCRGVQLNAPRENDSGLMNQAPTNLKEGVQFIEPKLFISLSLQRRGIRRARL